MNYKYLIPDGNTYKIKAFVSLFHVILIAWLSAGIATVVYSAYLKTGISIVAFTSLILLLVLLRPSKTRLLPDERMIKIDTGVRGKEPIQYHFSDFSGFELATAYYLRIPINTELFVRFGAGEAGKRHVLAQSFSKRKIQQLYNELEEVLNKF